MEHLPLCTIFIAELWATPTAKPCSKLSIENSFWQAWNIHAYNVASPAKFCEQHGFDASHTSSTENLCVGDAVRPLDVNDSTRVTELYLAEFLDVYLIECVGFCRLEQTGTKPLPCIHCHLVDTFDAIFDQSVLRRRPKADAAYDILADSSQSRLLLFATVLPRYVNSVNALSGWSSIKIECTVYFSLPCVDS